MSGNERSSIEIIYDGECPFCRSYITYCRLREAFDEITLTNARDVPGLVARYRAEGMEINKGMIVIHDGTTFYGAEAMGVLARLTRPAGALQRLMRLAFRRPSLGSVFYGALRLGRDTILALLGRRKID